ncbi:MAG: hypothetical protein OIF50_06340 [Flavobacteriaceae bacterium]|nr:hypothetical protein [Flavobacteriaceae bacterium]
MKTGNLYLLCLALLLLSGMLYSNLQLKNAYFKIDLTDTYKNYLNETVQEFGVVVISGSNGYAIDFLMHEQAAIKTLRNRQEHIQRRSNKDTLFLEFTGSNITRRPGASATTNVAIILQQRILPKLILRDTYHRISGFDQQQAAMVLYGKVQVNMMDNRFQNLDVNMENQSRIDFLENNTADSLQLFMKDYSVCNLQEIQFTKLNPILKDSVTFVFSKKSMENLLRNSHHFED